MKTEIANPKGVSRPRDWPGDSEVPAPEGMAGARGRISKQEAAYRWIKSRIVSGEYSAGYRIVIDRIAAELGCSAIPVREATRRLEAEGLVEYERNVGMRVTAIDARSYVETLAVLAVLEGYATALAARRLETAGFQRLRDINAQMAAARDRFDLCAYSELNLAFHRVIHEAAGQEYLLDQIRSTQHRMDSVRSAVFMLIPHRTQDSLAEHEELVRLMEAGAAPAEIERAAREHKLRTMEAFEEWNRQRGAGGAWWPAAPVSSMDCIPPM